MTKKNIAIEQGVEKIDELHRLLAKDKDSALIKDFDSIKKKLKLTPCWRYQWVIEHLPKKENMKILDIGAGTGMMSYMLSQLGHSVTAIDKEQKYLNMIDKDAPKVKTVLGDAIKLPFNDEWFDVVIALELIEHVDDKKVLQEMKRVLIKEGTMFITTPIEKNLLCKDHINFYNFYTLMDLFDTIGNHYTICRMHKFDKMNIIPNVFGIIYKKE